MSSSVCRAPVAASHPHRMSEDPLPLAPVGDHARRRLTAMSFQRVPRAPRGGIPPLPAPYCHRIRWPGSPHPATTPRCTLTAMSFQRVPRAPRGGIPHPHRIVIGSAGQARPIGRPRHAPHLTAMSFQRVPRAPRGGIHTRTVLSEDPLATPIRRPRHAQHLTAMSCGVYARAPWRHPTPAPYGHRIRWPGWPDPQLARLGPPDRYVLPA